MSLSLVVPTYTIDDELEEIALRAIDSYHKQVDELIVTEDGGRFSAALMSKADCYIYNQKNEGFTKNVNRGWRRAEGDYVAIVNSDTYLLEGDLRDLCVENRVTSPLIENQGISGLAGPFWVSPKQVTKECGYLKEEMRTYYSDEEYSKRIDHLFKKVSTVRVWHDQAITVTKAGVEGGEEAAIDGSIYKRLT